MEFRGQIMATETHLDALSTDVAGSEKPGEPTCGRVVAQRDAVGVEFGNRFRWGSLATSSTSALLGKFSEALLWATDFLSATASLEKSPDIILEAHTRLLGLLHVKTGEEQKRDQVEEPFFVQTSEKTLFTSPLPRPEVLWGFTAARPTPLTRKHPPGCLGPGFLCPVKPFHGLPSVLQKYVGLLICS